VLGLAAFARPDTLPLRRGRFEEVGSWITVTLPFPELLRPRDREALAWLESGFETTFVYEVHLWPWSGPGPVARHVREVRLRWDHLAQKFEAILRDDGAAPVRATWATREEALAGVLEARRLRVGLAAELTRGGPEGPFYMVSVLAQRNPLEGSAGDDELDPAAGRAQGRDSRWFSQFVGFLAGDVPEAEVTVRVRTQPFWLVRR
jgi:hypothetical protein